MNNTIEIIYKDIGKNTKTSKMIKEVVQECFKEEKIGENVILTITLTGPDQIKKINKTYRNIDKETDVLSFPMYEKEEVSNAIKQDIETILGDIIISIPKVEEQAKEYKHSFKRELSYMVVHGFYHLMGYDHIKDEDKKMMREKEEHILEKLNIID